LSTLRREVPDVTKFNSDVLPELNGVSRLGASSLRSIGLPGTGVLGVSGGTGLCAALLVKTGAHAVPRVRAKVAFVAPPQQDSVATLLGQTNIHNYMTGVPAVGEGASGPPRDREPV
jgi:hypothetical protein